MALDAKIEQIRAKLGISSPEAWREIEPAQVLAVYGSGLATLNKIRRQLASQGLCLKGDQSPEYWRAVLSNTDAIASSFAIAIDNSEKTPWKFDDIASNEGSKPRPLIVPTVSKSLDTGDYSIVGFEQRITIERKSLGDLYGTLGSGRDRFERELERMASFEVAMVVIEADLLDIMTRPPEHSRVPPSAIQGSIIAYSQRFRNVKWWPLPNRDAAERWAFRQLDRFYRDYTTSLRLEAHSVHGLASVRTGNSVQPGHRG